MRDETYGELSEEALSQYSEDKLLELLLHRTNLLLAATHSAIQDVEYLAAIRSDLNKIHAAIKGRKFSS